MVFSTTTVYFLGTSQRPGRRVRILSGATKTTEDGYEISDRGSHPITSKISNTRTGFSEEQITYSGSISLEYEDPKTGEGIIIRTEKNI